MVQVKLDLVNLASEAAVKTYLDTYTSDWTDEDPNDRW